MELLQRSRGGLPCFTIGGVEETHAIHDWKWIFHRDMKLDNVWLDIPDPTKEFPSYPIARLGDFGIRLMSRDFYPVQLSFDDGLPDAPRMNAAGDLYSEPLRNLVQHCVGFEPEQRPTLRQIRKQILEYTTPGGVNDLAEGMRTATHEEGDEEKTLHYQADQYKLALAAGL